MTKTLIAINGPSFNDALKRNSRLDPYGCRNRLHIDYQAFKNLLEDGDREEGVEICLNYYISEPMLTSRETEDLFSKIEKTQERERGRRQRGRVISFEKGNGIIETPNQNRFLVNWRDIEGTGFKNLRPEDCVSFIGQKIESGWIATTVRSGIGYSQDQYRLRKQSFYKSLVKFGYEVISCAPYPISNPTPFRNDKSIDIQICLDAMELQDGDTFILCSDDITFIPLLRKLSKRDVYIEVVTFEKELSDILKREADGVVVLDKKISEILAQEVEHRNSEVGLL